MKVNKFNQMFGRGANPEKERDTFVQRINQTAFKTIEGYYPYERTFRDVCYQLGINADDMISDANQMNYGSIAYTPHLRELTDDNFFKTLEVLVAAHESVPDHVQQKVDQAINLALAYAITDLGIVWKDGIFYPLGAKELDEKLINENLAWLRKFPDAQTYFRTALERFARSQEDASHRKDAVTNAYTSIEAMAQTLLKNKSNFDRNSDEVVIKLGLPNEYKNIIHRYKGLANNYSSRHAGDEFSHEEAEAFIYLTGLLMRLMIQKNV